MQLVCRRALIIVDLALHRQEKQVAQYGWFGCQAEERRHETVH